MAALPSQLHVKLSVPDHKKLASLAKRAGLSVSDAIRQLIRHARIGAPRA
jgi:hypothetical protein